LSGAEGLLRRAGGLSRKQQGQQKKLEAKEEAYPEMMGANQE
jgi:hypothetical protein